MCFFVLCQATSGLLLPRPLELSTEGVQEPPPLVDDVDDYDPEVSKTHVSGAASAYTLIAEAGYADG